MKRVMGRRGLGRGGGSRQAEIAFGWYLPGLLLTLLLLIILTVPIEISTGRRKKRRWQERIILNFTGVFVIMCTNTLSLFLVLKRGRKREKRWGSASCDDNYIVIVIHRLDFFHLLMISFQIYGNKYRLID